MRGKHVAEDREEDGKSQARWSYRRKAGQHRNGKMHDGYEENGKKGGEKHDD